MTHVLAIEPRRRNGRDEELRTVGVTTRVCHRKTTGTGMLELEVFVREFGSVDGLIEGRENLRKLVSQSKSKGPFSPCHRCHRRE